MLLPATVAACVLAAGVISFTRAGNKYTDPPAPARTLVEEELANRPVRVRPTMSMFGELNPSAVQSGVSRLTLGSPDSISAILHAVRLFGREATMTDPRSGRKVRILDYILDKDLGAGAFDGPALIDTREGVRCRLVVPRNARWQRQRQAHEDQLLGVMAETGVPLDQPLTTDGGTRTVRDILADTCANFHPDQGEIEWSGLAVALYLPPRFEWQDKFGSRHSIDSVVDLLMTRSDYERLACGGTHLLYTLTVILRVDETVPVLSAEVRARLTDHLRKSVALIVRTQATDGTWLPDWRSGQRAAPSPEKWSAQNEWPRVLLTGHQLEWLIHLPNDLQPPRETIRRAAEWLQVRLRADPGEILAEHYCPYSHAGRVLGVLASPAGVDPRGD